MRLAAVVTLAVLASAEWSSAASIGGAVKVDITPDMVLIVGDPQPGSNCLRWAAVADDAEDQACGAAQVARMVWLIEDAFSRYPIDAAIVEGDLVDSTQAWELTALADGVASLSDSIKSKLYFVGGNHDANDTNCTTLARYFSEPLDGTGSVMPLGDLNPIYWTAQLRRTRLIGFQSTLVTMRSSTACQAQKRAGKYPDSAPSGYGNATCFGDESAAVGATANLGTCAQDSDCQSGQCGTWEDLYEPTMSFIDDQVAAFIASDTDEALILNMHQALCRPTAASSCGFTEGGGGFSVVANLTECGPGSTTPGAYCDNEISTHRCINAISGLPSAADCVVGTNDREGFETRDRLIASLADIPVGNRAIVQATGHVGTTTGNQSEVYAPGSSFSNDSFSHSKDILGTGVPYLVAEMVGPYASGLTDSSPQAAVVRIPRHSPPAVIEYTRSPNAAPALDEIGTAGEITLSSGTDQYVFTGTDVDYQNLDYYIDTTSTPALNACLDLDQKSSADGSGDLDANLDATACASGRYPSTGEYTICITDGLLSGGMPTGNGLSSCEEFHVVVP